MHDAKHAQSINIKNSTLNLCLTPFEPETGIWIFFSKTFLNLTTGSTLKCVFTSVNLSICSFHRNLRLMLFFGSWKTTLRARYAKVQRYGALTSRFLYILIWKSEENDNFKMFKGSKEHFIGFQWTLDAFCEFEFCGYVVSLCHQTLNFYSIQFIFSHLITRIYIFMDVKFQRKLRIGTWHILL